MTTSMKNTILTMLQCGYAINFTQDQAEWLAGYLAGQEARIKGLEEDIEVLVSAGRPQITNPMDGQY